LAAFDLYILKRKNAGDSYSERQASLAESFFESLKENDKDKLTRNIIAGLPGGHHGLNLVQFRESLSQYDDIDANGLRNSLSYFLNEIIPVAEKSNISMCIHPDDPPFSILGLPRVVSSAEDLSEILNFVKSPNNGITFCTGSFGASPENDLINMAERFADRIHFIHLRSVQQEEDGSFYEAGHLEGSSKVAGVMNSLITSKKLTKDKIIPVRPDHGHKMMFELTTETGNPGYSLIGRMKGLSELKALETGLRYQNKQDRS
jgi:mannonate dehydratase